MNVSRFVAFTVLMAPNLADAQCRDGLVPTAFSARIDSDRASVLVDTLLAGNEFTVPVPTAPYTLSECPSFLEDTVVTPTAGDILIEPVTGELSLFDGGVEFRVVLDIDTEFDMAVQVCALPNTACQARVSGEALEVVGRARLSVDECAPDLVLESFDILPRSSSIDLELRGCGILYDWLGEALFSLFEDSILDSIREELNAQVETSAPELVMESLSRLATDGVEALGLRILAEPEFLSIDEGELQLRFAMGIDPVVTAPARCELRPPLESQSVVELPPTMPVEGKAAFTVAKAAIDRVVSSAWSAGWLCLDSRDLGVELSDLLEDIAPGVDVALLVEVPERPTVELNGDGETVTAFLDIPLLRVGVSTLLPDEPPGLVTLSSGAALTADVVIDGNDTSFRLIPRSVTTRGFELTSRAGPFVFDPDGLEQTMEIVVIPLIMEALEDLSLSGAFFAGDNLATETVQLAVDDAGIGAAFEIYVASPEDAQAPETQLAGDAPRLVPSDFVVEMLSVDETPPQQQVRHRLTIDGTRISRLRVGRALAFEDLSAGPHQIAVAAVDLAGNEDMTPVEFEVIVDTEPPTIEFTQAPVGILRDRSTELRYRVSDNLSNAQALRIGFQVGEVSRAVEPDLPVANGTLTAGQPLLLDGLREDRSYRVTLSARDEAGLETETVIAFAVDSDPTLDCSSAGISPWLLLAALVRRRRQRSLRT